MFPENTGPSAEEGLIAPPRSLQKKFENPKIFHHVISLEGYWKALAELYFGFLSH